MEISDYITVLKNGEVTGNLYPGDTDEHGLASLMVGRQVLFLSLIHICVPHLKLTGEIRYDSCMRKREGQNNVRTY